MLACAVLLSTVQLFTELTAVAAEWSTEGVVHHQLPGLVDPAAFPVVRHRKRAQQVLTLAKMALSHCDDLSGSSGIIRPSDYGADPTGTTCSSDAMDRAVAAMLARNGTVDGLGMYDLGGAILDLSGGEYLLSRPLKIPQHYANFRVQRGTLVAGPSFPVSVNPSHDASNDALHYLLQIGEHGQCNSTTGGASNHNCNSNVGIQQLTLDGRGVANGLLVADTMDADIGPAILAVGWPDVGISLAGTGAGYIHEAWLGEFPAGSKRNRNAATGTAIHLMGDQHDSDVNNVIIFSGKTGVNSSCGPNRIQGVHTWNTGAAHGGTGIHLQMGSGRVHNCYLDGTPLVVHSTGMHGVATITDNQFLLNANLVFVANPRWGGRAFHGMVVTGNVFDSTGPRTNQTIFIDESAATFANVTDSVIENNIVSADISEKHLKRGTRATLSAVVPAGQDRVVLDFTDYVLFPTGIGFGEINCWLNGPHVTALSSTAMRKDGPALVLVQLETPVPAVQPAPRDGGASYSKVTCAVDQSVRSEPAH
jgi:hypothetical protein